MKATFSASLQEEIEFRIALFREDEETDGEPATEDDLRYLVAHDLEEVLPLISAAWLTELRRYFIAVGRDRVVTDEELERTTVIRTNGRSGRKYCYKLDGLKYKFEKHPLIIK